MAHLDFEKPLVDLEERIRVLKQHSGKGGAVDDGQIERLEERAKRLTRDIYRDLSVWQKVQLSRHPDRPYFREYLERLFTDFVELHGDRVYGDDPAIIAGLGSFDSRSVLVVGQQKGRTTKDKLHRNFGMAHPEGYRKACRAFELADRFSRPVITFIDTPGAYPGLGAEERGQAEAIGQAILTMSRLRVPVIAIVIGEGGSGGALGLGIANRVLMLEYATYSVITPEGCASILWRDGTLAPKAAEQLKLLAGDAKSLQVIDAVVEEPHGGAHRDWDEAARLVGVAVRTHLGALDGASGDALVEARYRKFRAMGAFTE